MAGLQDICPTVSRFWLREVFRHQGASSSQSRFDSGVTGSYNNYVITFFGEKTTEIAFHAWKRGSLPQGSPQMLRPSPIALGHNLFRVSCRNGHLLRSVNKDALYQYEPAKQMDHAYA